MSQFSWRQISSANLGFAFPEKTLMPPVVLIKSLPISDCQLGVRYALACRRLRHTQHRENSNSRQAKAYRTSAIGNIKNGWGGWIRTNECRFQRPVPYHLATPQCLIAFRLCVKAETLRPSHVDIHRAKEFHK